MIGIVIVANGKFALELCDCLEQILGKQPNLTAITMDDGYDRQEKEAEICTAICEVDQGEGVVILTDIYGSSPSNISVCACQKTPGTILTGVNLPMLIKLVKSRNKSLSVATKLAFEAGRQHIRIFEER